MPKGSGGTIWSRVNRIRDFFNANEGYLLIIDEADKLINKYTQKKMEIIRGIFDQSEVGIVIAGEPRLEAEIKGSLARFANRMDFYYKLKGLSQQEVKDYLEGYDVDDAAMMEFISRATNTQTGCFRLLDRTLNNVIRILKESGQTQVTMKIVNQDTMVRYGSAWKRMTQHGTVELNPINTVSAEIPIQSVLNFVSKKIRMGNGTTQRKQRKQPFSCLLI